MDVYWECRKWGNGNSEIKLQSLIDRTGQRILRIVYMRQNVYKVI